MKLFLSFFYISLICISSFGQAENSFTPLKDDSIALQLIKENIKLRYIADSIAEKGENKKYTIQAYRERKDYITEMFSHKEILFSAETNTYLTTITNQILDANPSLKVLGSRFLFSRAYWPNASSMGEGTIIFNIGLFYRLQNESQVAFVLCHELAHLYLNHSNKSINQYIATLYSEEFQQKLKELKKQKYEKNKELAALEKGVVYKSRKHSREHESEADSMSVAFMKNTNFDTREAISCLSLLDIIDKDVFEVDLFMKQQFNFGDYPFQDKWLTKEEAFFGGISLKDENNKERDSLKTHPDCKQRISKLESFANSNIKNTAKKNVVSENDFNKYKKQFGFETIEFCYNSNRISKCLYLAMEAFKKYPNNEYLATTVAKCFNRFYLNQKEHTLNQIIDLPSPYQDEKYNILLVFLQNTNITDYISIAHYFMQQQLSNFNNSKEFTSTLKIISENYRKK